MRETEFSAEEKYQFYQRLMMAIFRMMRDARFLICYPYIKEGLETTIQTLGEEIRDIREERKKLEIFLKRFGLTLEDLDPRTRTRTRSGLRDALQRAALRHPGTTPRLVVITYNRLVQNGIDSLSQLRAIMDFNEVNIAAIRNLGQKSFRLISQVLEMTKKEIN